MTSPTVTATPPTRADLRAARDRRRTRGAVALVAAATVLTLAGIVGVLTFATYSPAPGFADVVRDDPRLDAFAPLSDGDTEALGQLVCSELNSERARIDLANQIAEDHTVDSDEAVSFVRVSVTHVCPHHE